jgi:hypothetical protein
MHKDVTGNTMPEIIWSLKQTGRNHVCMYTCLFVFQLKHIQTRKQMVRHARAHGRVRHAGERLVFFEYFKSAREDVGRRQGQAHVQAIEPFLGTVFERVVVILPCLVKGLGLAVRYALRVTPILRE